MSLLELLVGLYLGAGLLTLLIVLVASRPLRQRDPQSLTAMLQAQRDSAMSRWQRFAVKRLVPVLTGGLLVCVWPLVPLMKGTEWVLQRHEAWRRKRSVFRARREHLQERLSLQQIEARETVHDPLAAVPAVPFGHLNAAWRRFSEAIPPGHELWSFTAKWRDEWCLGPIQQRTGYVAVRRKVPGTFFINSIKIVDPYQRGQPADLSAMAAGPSDSAEFKEVPEVLVDDIKIPDYLRKRTD